MFKWYLNRLALLAAGVAAIGGAELTARYIGFNEPPLVILDDKIEYYLAPSRNYTRFGHDIRVNRYGMRSDDVDMASVDRRFNFSLLGDSVVYGNRLDQTDTLPAQLQKLLAGTDQKALVNSIAASGWGPENLFEFYKRFGPFPGNTAWIVQSSHDMVDVTHLVNKVLPYRTASPHGALHDLALSTWQAVTLRVLPSKADPVKWEDKRRRADLALHALITALKADYARVILVFHATRAEAIGGKADGLAHYRAVAKEEAIEFLSTMELYARAYNSKLLVHYDDIHLSKEGARVLSERLSADIGRVNARDCCFARCPVSWGSELPQSGSMPSFAVLCGAARGPAEKTHGPRVLHSALGLLDSVRLVREFEMMTDDELERALKERIARLGPADVGETQH